VGRKTPSVVRKTLVITAVSAALIVTAALSHEGATGIVGERMTVMKTMGQHLKALNDMLKGSAAFDPAAVRIHANALSENCHKAHAMFPPGSADHHSRTLPAVWEKPEAFEAEMQRFHDATAALASAAASGEPSDLAAPFMAVGRACASCHETFRQPE
jgi:cytochrome c556